MAFDPRRRPGSAPLAHGFGVARPSSAPRRRPVPTASSAGAGEVAWAKGRPAEPMGMLRQSSAPNLVPGGYGGSYESYHRFSRASYDVSRSPGMRRSASAANLNFARPIPAAPQRLPRRRLHEASPHYVSPGDRFRAQAPLRGFPQKADVVMESRLTERLREQSFSSVEPTRRRQRTAKAPVAGRTSWQGDGGGYGGLGHAYSGYATPVTRSAASSPYHGSAYSHSQLTGVPTELYAEEPSSESLKIYSDLFEEVIERDRVFGSLLRKVKAAYDTHLQGREAFGQVGPVPPMPVTESLPKALPRGGFASEPSLAPEACSQAQDPSQPWELHRENQALKDLIERLHMELEEAVKREQRWKNKAAKLKARANASRLSNSTQLLPPAQETAPYWANAGMHGFPQQMDGHWVGDARAAARPVHEPRSFHPNRREPSIDSSQTVQACPPEMLNQGGLFSLSSISQEPMGVPGAAASGTETARSDDSGYLPQRQERQVIRPASVPQLDLDKVQQHIEEDDEQEQEEEVVMEQEAEDGHASGPVYAGQREHHVSRELRPGDMPMDLGTPRLDPAEEDDLRRIFDACDREGDGTMNKWELIRLCQERPALADFFGMSQQDAGPRDLVEARFRSLEASADHKVTWEEFLDWYMYELQLAEARSQQQ